MGMTIRQEIQRFAEVHKLRLDWHEPDEQGIRATVYGNHLDNAFGDMVDDDHKRLGEYVIELEGPKGTIRFNLADLLADFCKGAGER